MPADSTKADLQAELAARSQSIHARTDALQQETGLRPTPSPPPERDDETPAALRNALLGGGGAFIVGYALRRLASGRHHDADPPRASTRVLTDTYLDRLAREVEARLGAGDGLADALGETLGRRAPLRIEAPTGHEGQTFVRLLALGLVAASAAGLNLACRAYYGRTLVELVRARLGGDDGSGDDAAYAPIHGTAGAEMPRPA